MSCPKRGCGIKVVPRVPGGDVTFRESPRSGWGCGIKGWCVASQVSADSRGVHSNTRFARLAGIVADLVFVPKLLPQGVSIGRTINSSIEATCGAGEESP